MLQPVKLASHFLDPTTVLYTYKQFKEKMEFCIKFFLGMVPPRMYAISTLPSNAGYNSTF